MSSDAAGTRLLLQIGATNMQIFLCKTTSLQGACSMESRSGQAGAMQSKTWLSSQQSNFRKEWRIASIKFTVCPQNFQEPNKTAAGTKESVTAESISLTWSRLQGSS